jgi:hypothetical protein
MKAWKWTVAAVAVALVGVVSPASTYSPGPGTPLGNREHPRIWLSRGTIPEINSKIANGMKSDYQSFVSYLDAKYAAAANDDRYYYYHIRNYAFVYAIGAVPGISYGRPLTDYAAKAKELMLAAVAEGLVVQEGGDHRVISVSAGYDWLYSSLTPTQRNTVASWLRQVPVPKAVDNPFHHTRSVPRYQSMIAGLAYAYDPDDDGSGDQRLNLYNAHIVGDGGSVNAANFYAGDAGGWSSGLQYSINGYSEGDAMSMLMTLEAGARPRRRCATTLRPLRI